MGNTVMFIPARMKNDGHVSNYKNTEAVRNLVEYCWNENIEDSIMRADYFGGNYLDLTDKRKAVKQIRKTQKIFGKSSGRRMCHYILTFDSTIRNAEIIKMIAEDVMEMFFSEYQTIYTIHLNTDNLHVHFIFNPVSIETGKKFSLRHREFRKMKSAVENLAIRHLRETDIEELIS